MKIRSILLITSLIFGSLFAQTPGIIYEPAAGGGAAILDPNGDGYTSATTSGFIADDQLESEIAYTSFLFPGTEPFADLNNGPNCGFSDFVDEGDRDPAQKFLSAGNNWMFRFRMGGTAPNSKSYSILLILIQIMMEFQMQLMLIRIMMELPMLLKLAV